ncbi:hypothetical protein FOH10_18345 [Nocardia otitidiscaviarum]|uniref:Protein kinase domain-containing protein n=1 Tax=Nocardia otitidiscaviarum TaxID=1823 RepID=A0A516NNA8_9NOCA|nr:hypothetical protein [Nocardia otitidiscaviarum]MCP9624401.1 hypothetical protein [Nocardia otitidiscaviarum]QDP80381.1 hypothetical protein FOH10_18345 [Nocardia otitidiscaviarum]
MTGTSGDVYFVAGDPYGTAGGRSRLFRCRDRHGRERVYKLYGTAVTDAHAIGWAARAAHFGREIVLPAERRGGVAATPESSIGWPLDLVRRDEDLLGAILPLTPGEFLEPDGSPLTLHRLCLAGQQPPDAYYRVAVAIRICEIATALEERDLVHGALFPRNLLWSRFQPHVYLLECDGLRYGRVAAPEGILLEKWCDPRLLTGAVPGPDRFSDRFGVAALLYRCLFLATEVPARARGGWRGPSRFPSELDARLRVLFDRAFSDPTATDDRPRASEWLDALQDAYLLGDGSFYNQAAVAVLDRHTQRFRAEGAVGPTDAGFSAAGDADPTARTGCVDGAGSAAPGAGAAAGQTADTTAAAAVTTAARGQTPAGGTATTTRVLDPPRTDATHDPVDADEPHGPFPARSPLEPAWPVDSHRHVPTPAVAPMDTGSHFAAVLAVVALAVAGIALVAVTLRETTAPDLTSSATSQQALAPEARAPVSTAPAFDWGTLHSATTDTTPFTSEALLPHSFRDAMNVEYTLRAGGVRDCITTEMSQNVKDILAQYNCTHMVAGSYVDHSNQILVSVNVLALPTSSDADSLYETMKGQVQDWAVWCPQQGPGASVCDSYIGAATRSGWGSKSYRYVYKSTALYINLTEDTDITDWLDAAAEAAVSEAGPENYWPR